MDLPARINPTPTIFPVAVPLSACRQNIHGGARHFWCAQSPVSPIARFRNFIFSWLTYSRPVKIWTRQQPWLTYLNLAMKIWLTTITIANQPKFCGRSSHRQLRKALLTAVFKFLEAFLAMETVGRANVAEHGTNYSMASIPSLQGKTRILAARGKCRKPGGGYVWICFYHTNLTLVKFSASEMQSWICHLNFTSAARYRGATTISHASTKDRKYNVARQHAPFSRGTCREAGWQFPFFNRADCRNLCTKP